MGRLSGKVAIITGAASGIGKEIAKRFADEGAKVVIADLQLPGAQATASEISQSGGIAMGVAINRQLRACQFLGKAPELASAGNRRMIV